MQVFNSFQEMTGTDAGVQSTMDVFNLGRTLENNIFDLSSGGTPPVDPAQKTVNPPPNIPQWGQTLKAEVDALKVKVDNGFAKMEQGFTEMRNSIADISNKLK